MNQSEMLKNEKNYVYYVMAIPGDTIKGYAFAKSGNLYITINKNGATWVKIKDDNDILNSEGYKSALKAYTHFKGTPRGLHYVTNEERQ